MGVLGVGLAASASAASPVLGQQGAQNGEWRSYGGDAGGNMFRAYDKDTGEVLWETELEAGTTGAPMTYMADGKQYIVVGIGEANRPAEFIALSLP